MTPQTARTILEHKDDDGSFYAVDFFVFRRDIVSHVAPVKCGGSDSVALTMGWRVATATTQQAAAAIAEALNVKYASEISSRRGLIDTARCVVEFDA